MTMPPAPADTAQAQPRRPARRRCPLRRAGPGVGAYGRFMLTPRPGSKPSLQARLVAVTLADQAGRALGSGHAARTVP